MISWTNEFAFLSRPGEDDIQIDLFYDYRTNVANYPAWGAWLRLHQPASLSLFWGKYDPSFLVAETTAYQRVYPARRCTYSMLATLRFTTSRTRSQT